MNKRDSTRRAVNGWDPAGLETSTSLDVRTRSSLITEIGHPWKILFKGNIWISQCHSLLRLSIVPVLLFVCCLLIKCTNPSGREVFILCVLARNWIYWSNPGINSTGIIPLETLRAHLPQRPHRFSPFLCAKACYEMHEEYLWYHPLG